MGEDGCPCAQGAHEEALEGMMKRHRVGRARRKRHTLVSIENLLLKAVESAGRRGVSYLSDPRTKVLLKEKRRLLLERERNAPW